MDKQNKTKPDWTPENAGDEFAVRIVKGVETNSTPAKNVKKRNELTVDELVSGVLAGDRVKLARTITLIESNAQAHFEKSHNVLQKLLPDTGKSIRIGISGVPGAGKSTLIEALGIFLINQGHKVAVLTIDPSSSITKGSILGDKTRMEKLSRENNCFIRPSPSGGALGGVARKSRETILVCEAAGYDIILIETVGVGQSEITVRSMVDFFLLVQIAGAGDELQGIKKGVMEISDAIAVNKADGDNETKANIARSEYATALHYLQPATEGWSSKALAVSALTGKGIEELWNTISEFIEQTKSSGIFNKRRDNQKIEWVFKMVEDELLDSFYTNEEIKNGIPSTKEQVLSGKLIPTNAAKQLLELFNKKD